jgi:hypothetical protein
MDSRGVLRLATDRLMRKQPDGDQPDNASRRSLFRGSIGALTGIAIASLVATKASAAESKLANAVAQYEDVSRRKGADCDDCIQFIPGNTANARPEVTGPITGAASKVKSAVRGRYALFAVALGTLLCAIVPPATHAQDVSDRSHVAGVANRAGVEVQLFARPPLANADSGPETPVSRSDRTEVVVTLTEGPPDLLGLSLVAEIHEGTCRDLESAAARPIEKTPDEYPLTPSVFSLRSFGAVLPISFATLRSSAHAITVRNALAAGIAQFGCVDAA